MNSKVVNKAIREEIKPFLKEKGFTEFTSRTAWKYSEQQIDVINFQSFNSYLAEGVGCTTYSFAINLGVYYKFFESTPWFNGKSKIKPAEYECHVRDRVIKGINQAKLFHPYNDSSAFGWEKDRDDIWYVKEDGSNLDEVINDAKEQIAKKITYFEEMSDLSKVIKIYEKEVSERGMYWVAADMISTLAMQLGDVQRGIKAYGEIMNDPKHIKTHDLIINDKKLSWMHDLHEDAKIRIEMLHKLNK